MRQSCIRGIAEILDKDLIPAIGYSETVDPQKNICMGSFTFADYKQDAPVYITVKPCESPVTVELFRGGFASTSSGVLTKK